MTRMIEAFNDRARPFADMAQPVIVAIGTAGLTGGTMAAIGMLADRALRRRRTH